MVTTINEELGSKKVLNPLFGEMELGVGQDRWLLNSRIGTNCGMFGSGVMTFGKYRKCPGISGNYLNFDFFPLFFNEK